eukprot:g7027.t1
MVLQWPPATTPAAATAAAAATPATKTTTTAAGAAAAAAKTVPRAAALGGASVAYDHDLEATTKNVNAGWSVFDSDADDDRDGFVGWQGYGGSALQFHPREQIGFGFAMNLAAIDLNNAALDGLPGGGGYLHVELQREALRAARRARSSSSS